MAAIDEGESIVPKWYDAHGCACYDDDLLDLRWSAVRDDLGGFELEMGVHSLLYSNDVDLIRKGVEIIGLLAERQIRRLAYPGLLDEESGVEWHRTMRVGELRAHPRYAVVAAQEGWPADPAELDEDQMDAAVFAVLLPHVIAKLERPDS
jgi:hypothetical protein